MAGSPTHPEAKTATEQASGHTPTSDRWLTVQEVADRLHVSRDTVERWIHASQLRAANVSAAFRRGRYRPRWRVPHEALEEFLIARLTTPTLPAKSPIRRRSAGIIEFIK